MQLPERSSTWQSDQAASLVQVREQDMQLAERSCTWQSDQTASPVQVKEQAMQIPDSMSVRSCTWQSDQTPSLVQVKEPAMQIPAPMSVRSCSCLSRASAPSSARPPFVPHTGLPVRTLTAHLKLIQPRVGAPGLVTSPSWPGTLRITEMARPSGPMTTSKAVAATAASIQSIHNFRVPLRCDRSLPGSIRSGTPGMLSAGTPPPVAVPNMVSRWQANDALSAREMNSVVHIPATRVTLPRRMQSAPRHAAWGRTGSESAQQLCRMDSI